MPETTAMTPQEKLAAIIAERGLSNAEAARQIGVTDPALLYWRRPPGGDSGGKVPQYPYRLAIRKWTEGSSIGPIEPEEWETDEERAVVARVRPFEPAAKPEAA